MNIIVLKSPILENGKRTSSVLYLSKQRHLVNSNRNPQEFSEDLGKLKNLCDRFYIRGDIEDLDRAIQLQNKLHTKHGLRWDLIGITAKKHRWNELSRKYGGRNV